MKIDKYMSKIAYLLFFFILVIPISYKLFKIGLIALLLVGVTLKILQRKNIINKNIFYIGMFYASMGIIWAIYGAIMGNPGAIRTTTVTIAYPLLFTFLITYLDDISKIKSIDKLIIFSNFLISLYGIWFILNILKIIPNELFINLFGDKLMYSNDDTYIAVSYSSISTLIFTIPYLITKLLTESWKNIIRKNKFNLVILALALIITVFTRRNALILISGLSVLIAFYFKSFLPKNVKIRMISFKKFIIIATVLGILLVLGINFFVNFNWEAMYKDFLNGFNFANDESASVRRIQFFALIESWWERPLIGHGSGAVASIIRSEEYPWAYELFYVSMLKDYGIIGLSIYFLGIMYIYYNGVKIIRKADYLSLIMLRVLVGTTSFLIATATNPYLGKFDYMWIVFLPVALINYYKLNLK